MVLLSSNEPALTIQSSQMRKNQVTFSCNKCRCDSILCNKWLRSDLIVEMFANSRCKGMLVELRGVIIGELSWTFS